MSTIDEKYQKVVVNPVDEIIGSEKGSSAIILVFFIAGLVASLVVGWVIFPKVLYSQKKQPFDFSHVAHADEDCLSCHKFREDGTFEGVPKLAKCMECHEEGEDPLGDELNEKFFVEEYVNKKKEIPWLVYSKQPDCVFFSHAAHKKAGMDCKECHGDIGTSKSLKVYEENRLTGISRDVWGKSISGFRSNTWDSMKMDDCAECHEKFARQEEKKTEHDQEKHEPKNNYKGACFQCHK